MPQDHFAVSLPWNRADLALRHVFVDKRQLDPAAAFASQMVLPPEVILFQCLCMLGRDHLQEDDRFFAHYGIRLIASITRELAGIRVTKFFSLSHWVRVIGTPTYSAHPLHPMQITKIRECLTKGQAVTAEDKEKDSNARATIEDYLQAFYFVEALLLVRVNTQHFWWLRALQPMEIESLKSAPRAGLGEICCRCSPQSSARNGKDTGRYASHNRVHDLTEILGLPYQNLDDRQCFPRFKALTKRWWQEGQVKMTVPERRQRLVEIPFVPQPRCIQQRSSKDSKPTAWTRWFQRSRSTRG